METFDGEQHNGFSSVFNDGPDGRQKQEGGCAPLQKGNPQDVALGDMQHDLQV
jgi:hypothetical protein